MGAELIVTPDHLIFERTRGWIHAGELSKGQKILGPSEIPVYGSLQAGANTISYHAKLLGEKGLVPEDVFQYTRDSLCRLLGEIWREFGRVHSFTDNPEHVVWINTPNREVAETIKHLLLRIGVDSRLDDEHVVWIQDPIDVMVFLKEVGLDVEPLDIRGPRRWDHVENISDAGYQEVYDLEVFDPNHNFLGSDLVVHNSFSICLKLLWYATTKRDRRIVVLAPSEKQISELFDIIDRFVDANPIISSVKGEPWKRQPEVRTFQTGSVIKGFPISSSAKNAKTIRGFSPHIFFIDEAHLFDEYAWTSILPMIVGDQYKEGQIRAYFAGTVEDPSGYFYETIFAPKDAIPDFRKIIFVPITENKDPYFTPERIEEIKKSVPEYVWYQEYLLKPSSGEKAVFTAQAIQKTFTGYYSYDNFETVLVKGEPVYIGVDWDKSEVGTNIVVAQYVRPEDKIRIVYRTEVPRGERSYLNAIDTVTYLTKIFQPEGIIVDHGMGGVQMEIFKDRAKKTGDYYLIERLQSLSFASKEEIRDPVTGETREVPVKPFLVDMVSKLMEDGKIEFPVSDKQAMRQFSKYHIVGRTERTVTFSRKDEHIIDCVMFCVYGIYKRYNISLKPPNPDLRVELVPDPVVGDIARPTGISRDRLSAWDEVENLPFADLDFEDL